MDKKDNNDRDIYLTKGYIRSIILGIIIGSFFSVAGFVLSILGISGSIEWIMESNSIQSKLSNASPGVFFALLGFLTLWRYKPNIQSHKSQVIDTLTKENSFEQLVKKVENNIVKNILSNQEIEDIIYSNSKKLASDLTIKKTIESALNDYVKDNVINKVTMTESKKLASNATLRKQ